MTRESGLRCAVHAELFDLISAVGYLDEDKGV
jgi:hypothetical protein